MSKALAAIVNLDSVVITATRQGFEVEDFVDLVLADTSLHTAFSNLRRANCTFETSMQCYNRKSEQTASMRGNYVQQFEDRCREIIEKNETVTGDFYKGRKQKRRYYTAKLYDKVFVTHGRVCESEVSVNEAAKPGKMDQHIDELKKLIFSPGREADVPLIGKKTALFSEDMIGYYDFAIRSDTLDGTPVYVFVAQVKTEFEHKENKTVIKSLETWFSKEDFQVMSRNYTLSHNTAVFMFDVTMHVDLVRFENQYVPEYVNYSGIWNVPFQKKENAAFEIQFQYFARSNSSK